MIQVGRAERMIVIAGDSASSDNLMPWLGNGFRALGAATTCANVCEASVPFNVKRSGMILGFLVTLIFILILIIISCNHLCYLLLLLIIIIIVLMIIVIFIRINVYKEKNHSSIV
jgi:hypothetical protein